MDLGGVWPSAVIGATLRQRGPGLSRASTLPHTGRYHGYLFQGAPPRGRGEADGNRKKKLNSKAQQLLSHLLHDRCTHPHRTRRTNTCDHAWFSSFSHPSTLCHRALSNAMTPSHPAASPLSLVYPIPCYPPASHTPKGAMRGWPKKAGHMHPI